MIGKRLVQRSAPPMTVHGWLRFHVIERLLPPDVRTVLEIGAGQGALGAVLAKRFGYIGLEPDRESWRVAAARVGENGEVLCVRAEDYVGDPVELVCAYEVLEHLEDDVGSLRGWRSHLMPRGWLMVSVPAGQARFGPHDERQGHFRRYDRPDLVRVLTAAGFEDVTVVNYAFPIGPLLYVWSNAQARRKPKAERREDRTAESSRWMQPSRGRARRLVAAPFAVVQRPFASIDWGTGFVARARLPDG